MVYHLLLDMSGVLYFKKKSLGPEVDGELIKELFERYHIELDLGTLPLQSLLDEYNSITGSNLDTKKYLELVHEIIEFNQELIDYCIKRSDVFRACITSDNYIENISYIKDHYDLSFAKDLFFSYDLKVRKDQGTDFFEKVIKKLNTTPENCVFVDDFEPNIANAKSAGIKAFLFRDNEELFQELDKF